MSRRDTSAAISDTLRHRRGRRNLHPTLAWNLRRPDGGIGDAAQDPVEAADIRDDDRGYAMSDTHDVRDPEGANSDAALLHRLFDLTWSKRGDCSELERVESQVYARLAQAYDAPEPPTLAGYGRVAA